MSAHIEFRRKAIPGFGTLERALVTLMRFGPGCFGALKWCVLMYHVERCDTWGSQKSQDAHSVGQALSGVFDRTAGEWVRGPAGVGETTYKQLTRELVEVDQILSRAYISSRRGDADPPVFQVNWVALRDRIEAYRRDLVGSYTPLFADPTPDEQPSTGVQETLDFDNRDNPDNLGVGRVATQGGSRGDPGVGRVATPQSVDITLSQDLHSVDPTNSGASSERDNIDIVAIRDAIERTLPEPLSEKDPLPAQFAAMGDHSKLTTRVMIAWIEDQAEKKRAAGDPILSAGYWAHIVKSGWADLDKWLRQNRRMISRMLEADQLAARAREIATMRKVATAERSAAATLLPEMPAFTACPQCRENAAVPVGDMLMCTSAACDPRGLLWADLLKYFTPPAKVGGGKH